MGNIKNANIICNIIKFLFFQNIKLLSNVFFFYLYDQIERKKMYKAQKSKSKIKINKNINNNFC